MLFPILPAALHDPSEARLRLWSQRQQALRCRWPFPWHPFPFPPVLHSGYPCPKIHPPVLRREFHIFDSIPASPGIFWPSGTETPHPTYSLQNNLHNLTGMWIQTAPTGLQPPVPSLRECRFSHPVLTTHPCSWPLCSHIRCRILPALLHLCHNPPFSAPPSCIRTGSTSTPSSPLLIRLSSSVSLTSTCSFSPVCT